MRQWAPTAWTILQLQAFRHHATAAKPALSQVALIKQLRERSGSPITDVKSCLEATGWDIEAAYDALRKKGLAAAAKKASRHATEGLIGCAAAPGGRAAALVELNSETDFVARNDLFQSMVGQVAAAALATPSASTSGMAFIEMPLEQVLEAPTVSGQRVKDAVAEVAAQVRENVRLRRAYKCDSTTGCVSTYLHQSPAPGLGRIAVMMVIQPAGTDSQPLTQAEVQQVDAVGRQLAMHVAGLRPQYVSRAQVPADALEKERTILQAHPSTAGKPPVVVKKMVEGRLSKYFEDAVLMDQRFLLDDGVKVSAVLDRLSKAVGRPLHVSSFLRVQCGEGLEARTNDFAAEVASMAAGGQ